MPGSVRTKQELANSLKELMLTQPLERIAVGDIVEHAGLGRNTFYYHFQDKYDLVNWIFESEAMPLLSQKITHENWDANLHAVEEYLRANNAFYCHALAYTGQNCLQDYIYERTCKLVTAQGLAIPAGERPGLTDEDIRATGEVIACTFLGLLLRWTRNGMQQDTHVFHTCLQRIVDGSLLRSQLQLEQQASG
jgi:probable dihydroxyacetone kinase regulator